MIDATGPIFGIIALMWLVALAGYFVGIAAIISIASTRAEVFGPWWDNTRQTWLVGIVISFLIPLGTLITGLMWFFSGRQPLREGRLYAGRPFWAGPSRPAPPDGGSWPPPPR